MELLQLVLPSVCQLARVSRLPTHQLTSSSHLVCLTSKGGAYWIPLEQRGWPRRVSWYKVRVPVSGWVGLGWELNSLILLELLPSSLFFFI